MHERFDVVVFDWDGTLIDSTAVISHAIRASAVDLGFADPGIERARHVIGLGLHEALAKTVPELPAQRMPEFVSRYRHHFFSREDELELFDSARELIADLRGRGKRLAIATGKNRSGLARALQSLGLSSQFDTTRCADESEAKPSPKMLLEIASALHVETRRMLMIGDTTHDLQMALAAGVDAVAVTHGAHSPQTLRSMPSLAVVDSLSQLRRWLIPG
jgi:phosphoglycolate phosphatase